MKASASVFIASVLTFVSSAFVDISKFIGKEYNGKKITGSMSFADAVIDGGIALIPGLPFYQDNYVRLSYAVSMSDIEEGLNRFENIISNIK